MSIIWFPPQKKKKNQTQCSQITWKWNVNATRHVFKKKLIILEIYTYYYHMYFVCIYALYDTEE